jgi:hypothetical protein
MPRMQAGCQQELQAPAVKIFTTDRLQQQVSRIALYQAGVYGDRDKKPGSSSYKCAFRNALYI